jgi:hypothetical protein
MDHEHALALKAVERYALGELSPAEQDAFEEHFFTCSECAERVRETGMFVENARAVLRTERAPAPAHESRLDRWFNWLRQPAFGVPVLASSVLAVLVGVQFVQMRGMREQLAALTSPQPLATAALRPLTRGEPVSVDLDRSAKFFHIVMDPDPEQIASAYTYEIRSETGETVVSRRTAPAPEPGAPLRLLLPADRFSDGTYTVYLQPDAQPNARGQQFRFRVQRN